METPHFICSRAFVKPLRLTKKRLETIHGTEARKVKEILHMQYMKFSRGQRCVEKEAVGYIMIEI